jgi:hypothetical protein
MAASDHLGPQFSAPYDLPEHYAKRAIPTMDLREASSQYGADNEEKHPTAEMRRYNEAMGRLKKANYPGL